MLGTGSKPESTEFLTSLFKSLTNDGHYGVIDSRGAFAMKDLILKNERKV